MKKHLLKLQKVKNNIILPLALIMCSSISAQVGIGTETPSATSVLDVESTTKGFLPPRLSTIQRDKILSPAEGLVIYNTSIHCLEVYNKTVWVNMCNTVAPPPPPPPTSIIRIGRIADFMIGDAKNTPEFHDQLEHSLNYGPTGIYNGISGFSFSDLGAAASTITETPTELKAKYDIICIGLTAFTTAAATKLKEYVDLGGVLIATLDYRRPDQNIHKVFGGTGSLSLSNVTTMTTSSASSAILSSAFGTNNALVTLEGVGIYAKIKISQLAPGSTLLASNGTDAGVWVTGPGGRAIFTWNYGILKNNVVRGEIDNPQEVFMHNLMAYAIDKARGLP